MLPACILTFLRCWLVTGLVLLPWGLPGQSGFAGRQVLTAAMLRSAGVTRLAEVLHWADDWQSTGVDGFTWDAAPAGMAGFQGARWRVLVDGVRIDVDLLDIPQLNLLPLSIAAIDSVEIFSIPQIQGGEFNDRGLIHLHTRRPASGLLLRLHGWIGNETGDPGPYIFTNRASPNVDRNGPDGGLSLSYRTSRWFLQAGLLEQSQYLTDAAIRARNPGRDNEYLRLQLGAPSLRLGWEGAGSRHDLFAGYSTSTNPYPDRLAGAAPLFFKPYGGEVATRRLLSHAGLKGVFDVSPRLEVAYQLSNGFQELKSNPAGAAASRINWRMNRLHAGMESRYRGKSARVNLGAGVRRFGAEGAIPFSEDNITLTTIYAQLEHPPTHALRHQLDLLATSYRSERGIKLASRLMWEYRSGRRLFAGLAYTERMPAEDTGLWFWNARGAGFLQDLGVAYQISGEPATSRMWSADLGWQRRFSAGTLQLAGGYRGFAGLSLARQYFREQRLSGTFSGPLTLHHNLEGSAAILKAILELQIAPRLRLRWRYAWQNSLSGSNVFRQEAETLAKHRLNWQLDWQAATNFSLWGAVDYRSGSYWEDYRDIAQLTGGWLSPAVRGVWVTDLALQKHLWQRRIRGNLVFRNIFEGDQHFHPLGAGYDLQFYFHFEMALPAEYR